MIDKDHSMIEKEHSMIETRSLKNVVIFNQTIILLLHQKQHLSN